MENFAPMLEIGGAEISVSVGEHQYILLDNGELAPR